MTEDQAERVIRVLGEIRVALVALCLILGFAAGLLFSAVGA